MPRTPPEAGRVHGTTWWVELSAVAVVVAVYLASPPSSPSAQLVAEAERNGLAVLRLQEHLGIDVERSVQAAALSLGLPSALNWLYGTLHFAVTAMVFVHLFRRRPEHYQRWRAGFVIASVAAFAIYRLWPVAPPRLLPDGSGGTHLVDTLAAHPTPWDFQHGPMSEVANQYAAMPSMHAGWALFCALAFGLGRSRRVRIALLGYPLLTTLVIMATGNHFLLDAVAGFAVVGAGMAAATLGERLITALRATHSAPALTGAEGATASESENRVITVHRARRRAHAASFRERGPAEFARISDAPLSPTPAKRRVMENTTTKGTARRVLLAATAIAAFALSACTTPPAPTDPSTRWLPAGCVDSSVPGVPDIDFTGVANVLNNASAYQLTPEGAFSEDGSCTTGIAVEKGTIVRASDSAAAAQICTDLGVADITDPARLVDYGYDAPIDAWTCINNPQDA